MSWPGDRAMGMAMGKSDGCLVAWFLGSMRLQLALMVASNVVAYGESDRTFCCAALGDLQVSRHSQLGLLVKSVHLFVRPFCKLYWRVLDVCLYGCWRQSCPNNRMRATASHLQDAGLVSVAL